jgi:cation:H+ antiporter
VVSIEWLLISLVVIIAGCELFTNAIEWAGAKLRLSEGIVGSVLAAVGTAMPETLVSVVAILFVGTAGAKDIGIGAILGAPFLLSTLAFVVTGLSVFIYTWRRRRTLVMSLNARILMRDMRWFVLVYAVAIAVTGVAYAWLRSVVAVALVGAYCAYVVLHARDQRSADAELPSPLRFQRNREVPRLRWVAVQWAMGLGLIIIAAHEFVKHVEILAHELGVAPLVLSLIIVPIATELPEKFNSIIWIGQRKDTLALGNISGAMVFQSCIPTAIGILFTDWKLTGDALVSAAIALVSATIVLGSIRLRGGLSPYVLLLGAPLYLVFLLAAFGGFGP